MSVINPSSYKLIPESSYRYLLFRLWVNKLSWCRSGKRLWPPRRWPRTGTETCRSTNQSLRTLCNRLVLNIMYLI